MPPHDHWHDDDCHSSADLESVIGYQIRGVGSGTVLNQKNGRIRLVVDEQVVLLELLARHQGAGLITLLPPRSPAHHDLGNQHLLLPRRQSAGIGVAVGSITSKVSPVAMSLPAWAGSQLCWTG